MTIYIGSARSDENGKYSGGKPGDQRQTTTPDLKGEVSIQPFYIHKKGWDVLRPRTKAIAQGTADAMIRACANACIGYSQSDRLGIIRNGTRTKEPTNCDCSSLVRQCVNEASALNVGNFDTANEAVVLMATGMFEMFSYVKGMKLYSGDILVTKTKGHTAIVTMGEPKTAPEVGYATTRDTIRVGSRGKDVKYLHSQLKKLKYGVNPESDYFDATTKICVINFQASHPPLEIDGVCGQRTWEQIDKI